MHDIILLHEIKESEREFDLFKLRELIYWSINIHTTKHITRDKIFKLPSEIVNKERDYVKEYEARYAERQLKKIMKWKD